MSHSMVMGVSKRKQLYVRKQNSGRSQRRILDFKLERRPFDAGVLLMYQMESNTPRCL